MALIKRELTRASRQGRPFSVVSVIFDNLTGAAGSIECAATGEPVRFILDHALLPAISLNSVAPLGVTTVIAIPAGHTFIPGPKATGGRFQNASYRCYWPA
jgi:hypothetical protein